MKSVANKIKPTLWDENSYWKYNVSAYNHHGVGEQHWKTCIGVNIFRPVNVFLKRLHADTTYSLLTGAIPDFHEVVVDHIEIDILHLRKRPIPLRFTGDMIMSTGVMTSVNPNSPFEMGDIITV